MENSFQRKIEISHILPIMVALFVGLLSIILWQALNVREDAQIKLAVEQEALTLKAEIKERIEPKILSLIRMAKRWETRGGTPRAEWEADAAFHIAQHTSQRGIAWVDSSYVSRWSVPLIDSTRYIGRDYSREEQRRVALESAWERREVTLTRTLPLTWRSTRKNGGRGLRVIVPLFVGERFDGYLIGVFRIQELLDPLLSEHASLGYSIVLFEGDEEIAEHAEATREEHRDWFEVRELEIRNLTWRIQVWPRPELVAKMRSSLPELSLTAGLLLALLMSITVRLAKTARLRAEEVGTANQDLEVQIAERKLAEEALRFTQFATDHASDAAFWMDADGRFFYVNDAACKLLDYSRDELKSMSTFDINPDYRSRGVWQERWQVIKQKKSATIEARFQVKDGRILPVEITSNFLEFEGREYNCSFVRDITERKQAEEKIQRFSQELEQRVKERTAQLQQSRENLRALTGQLISMKEAESKHLARELHDALSQRLAVLGMDVSALEQQLPSSPDSVGEGLRLIVEEIGKLAKDVHQLSLRLHPSILDDLGLVAAVRAECAAFSERMGFPIEFLPKNVPESLPEDVSLCLYRVTQESLQNIDKHANAEKVHVTVTGVDRKIVLVIEDTGGGFDLGKVKGNGRLGLISMDERVRLVNGSFSVQSQPGQGTRVQVHVPLTGVSR